MITVYGMPSPNVRKVLLMLEELEVPYQTKRIGVFDGDQFDPAFRAISPFSKVPVLVEDGADGAASAQSICESGAILIYLAERFGAFLPSSGTARYAVMQWLMIQMANVGPMLGQLNHFKLVGEAGRGYPLDRYKMICERTYTILDQRLAESEYLAGPDYSIADIATYHWSGYLERHGHDAANFPHLTRWRDAIAARPAAIRELAAIDTVAGDDQEKMRSATTEQLDRFFWRKSLAEA